LKLLDKLGPLKTTIGKRRGLLGVELSSSSVKIAELKISSSRSVLQQAHVVPIPPGKVTMGNIEDQEGLASELDSIWSSLNIKNRNISLALPGNLTILRRSRIPYVPPEEVEKAIKWEIEKTLPFKLEEIHFDFHVYEFHEGESINLIYVVARKNIIESYQHLFQIAGINLEVLDSAFLALANTTIVNYEELADILFMVIDMGAESSNLLVIKNNRILYSRNVEVGGILVNQTLAQETGCTLEEAEQLKLSGDADEATLREASHALATKLYGEVVASLNYSQNLLGTQEQIDRIYTTGGASNTPFLVTELNALLNADIETLSPVRKVDLNPQLDPTYIDDISTRIPVAMGTALRSL
jgi:type IV pilus assembly protein PilM